MRLSLLGQWLLFASAGIVRGQIFHILLRQCGRYPLHAGVITCPGLVCLQGFYQIFSMLTAESRHVIYSRVGCPVSFYSMAADAHGILLLSCLRITYCLSSTRQREK